MTEENKGNDGSASPELINEAKKLYAYKQKASLYLDLAVSDVLSGEDFSRHIMLSEEYWAMACNLAIKAYGSLKKDGNSDEDTDRV